MRIHLAPGAPGHGEEGSIVTTGAGKSASVAEGLAAELAATNAVALWHGLKGPFIDLELEPWRELPGVLSREEKGATRLSGPGSTSPRVMSLYSNRFTLFPGQEG